MFITGKHISRRAVLRGIGVTLALPLLESMAPALGNQDGVLINRWAYLMSSPQRGDVVMLRYPRDERKAFIKRVIAQGGDTLRIDDGRVYVNERPLDESCRCSVCLRHTRAYLRHLYIAGEMLASILLTHHNLAFFLDTMRGVRQSIRSGDFPKFRREFTERLGANGE